MWYIQFSFAYTILLILNQFSIHQAFVSIQLLSNRLYQRKQLYAETSTFQQRNALQNNKNNKTAGSNGRLPLPFMELSSVGLIGRWQERAGNYILKPKSSSKPLGVIHFLGGAFVGAAPHLTYKYLLETLGNAGYVIVATPYRLDMDYTTICDGILSKFDVVGVELAQEYGPLPVIGLGHSCGALLQTLVTSLFPDTPRALNILISYNNKPASQAIPAFQEAIIPLAEMLAKDTPRSKQVKDAASSLRSTIDRAANIMAESAIAPAFVGNELVPLLRQSLEVSSQVLPLLNSIGSGNTEFVPSPVNAKEVCRRMYRARKTLLLKFENDGIDESADIERVLREANTIMRMKRPMVEMEVELKVIKGTHITPLTQNVFVSPSEVLDAARDQRRSSASGISVSDNDGSDRGNDQLATLINVVDQLDFGKSARIKLREQFLQTVDGVTAEILTFLESSIISPQIS